jgi:hypothetical protein
MTEPQPPFRVSWICRAQVEGLMRRAQPLGLGPRLADELEQVGRRLENEPLGWGDPLFRYRSLKLVVHLRIYAKLRVVYAVHYEQSVVFVRDIRPVFDHPLAGGG